MTEFKESLKKSFGTATGIVLAILAAALLSALIGLAGLWVLGVFVLLIVVYLFPVWLPMAVAIALVWGMVYACSPEETPPPTTIERSIQ